MRRTIPTVVRDRIAAWRYGRKVGVGRSLAKVRAEWDRHGGTPGTLRDPRAKR